MQNHLEMFEFNENYACLKFNIYGILPHISIHFIRRILPALRAKHGLQLVNTYFVATVLLCGSQFILSKMAL